MPSNSGSVIIQLVTDSVDHPSSLVNRLIIWRTMPKGSTEKHWPVHCRIYFSLPDETFEVTVWGGPFKSGMKISWGELPCDIRMGFKDESKLDIISGIECALAMANNRSLYAFALLAFNIVLIPTRRLWNYLYRRTGWAPFNGGSDTDCSFAVDRICQAMGVQLFGKKPASLIAPGDFLSCRLLKTL